jgi:DNA-binding response OmpR family regulator
MSKFLLVEDEKDLADQIRDWLEREGHLLDVCHDGAAAFDILSVCKYDALILDWLLPKMDGISLCKSLRNKGIKTPVLILTAKASLENKEEGFDAGADDYLSKPFHLKELSIRLKALVRRAAASTASVFTFGDITIDPAARKVSIAGAEVHLEKKEFNLLEFLARNGGRTFSAEAILDRVWESESAASPDTIRTYIKALRKKLDQPGKRSIITTVHGVGYRIDADA